MAIVTAVYECKGGPADGEVVELPWDATECALEHAVTGARDRYAVPAVGTRRRVVWAKRG